MEFSWTTFILEIVNFLVLLWILQRLLYRPVMNAIAQRRTAIEKTLEEARAIEAKATALSQQYEGRLSDWQREKESAQARLTQDLEAERARRMQALQAELAAARERQRAVERQQARERERRMEVEARAQAATFAARLLSRIASTGLEAQVIRLVLEDLPNLSAGQLRAIRAALAKDGVTVEVVSADVLGGLQRETLTQAVSTLAGTPLTLNFREDPTLIAGLSMIIGPWVLRANLRDELQFFAEADQHAA
jgi:F-type H+-transporting ATPase subunit b